MKVIFTSIIVLLASFAHSQELSFKNECQITPAIWELKPWPKPYKSNNLRRHAGATELAKGEKIIVTGAVTDENCMPVMGAIIQIWQADSLGVMRGYVHDKRKPDVNFLNSGVAITDNFGQYSFITVMPGALPHRAPFINFRVTHEDFLDTETVMYFDNQALNGIDNILNHKVSKNLHHLLVAKSEISDKYIEEESIKYKFDISLEGKNKYLKY